MKGRSHHRLPISEPPDDWVDGSWTVDCVCGVNFDDGEEMVNCDECGVWVHTRCSRFVRGEKSFACDKCKTKKNRNENEETEVAQLLVELPTKTIRMDNPYPLSVPPRAPFRLWTDIPIKERVHVQGVPGGDPALFQGLSSVFTSELWKCTGHVPKKFNFNYREFPCWDENRGVETRLEEENENPVDRGADVLFSLSKDIIPYVPPADTLSGLRDLSERKSSRDMKKQDNANVFSGGSVQNCMNREVNQLHLVGINSGKQRKEELGLSKDWNAEKKETSADKEVDRKKKDSTPIDARTSAFDEDGDSRVPDPNFQHLKSDSRKETINSENLSGQLEATNKSEEHKYESLAKSPSKAFTNEASGHNFPSETQVKVEAIGQHAAVMARLSPKTNSMGVPQVEANDVKISVKEKDVKTADDALNHLDKSHNVGDLNGGSSSVAVDLQKSEPADGELRCTEIDMAEVRLPQGSDGVMPPTNSPQTTTEVKTDSEDDPATGNELPSQVDRKPDIANHLPQHLGKSSGHLSENLQADTALSSGDYKSQDCEKEPYALNCSYIDATKERVASESGEHHCSAEESENVESSMALQERSPEFGHGSKFFEEPGKLASTNPATVAPSLRRLVLGVGKSSASSPVVLSKSSASVSYKVKTASSVAVKPSHLAQQRVKVDSGIDCKKEIAANGEPRDNSIREVSKGPLKDHPKSSAGSATKTSHTSRVSNSSMSKQALLDNKHNLSDTKQQVLGLSSNASAAQNGAASVSGEPNGLSQSQTASLDKKPTTSGSFQNGEKTNQSTYQTQSKVFNQTPPMPPPASVNLSTTLSDQELALLLHQELNSSPRVPRVPRMRHAGSITQLASPPSSTHSRRPSSYGAKDQFLASRKKNKEETYTGSPRSSRELIDETRTDKSPPSPDHRRKDPDVSSDGIKRDGRVKCPDALATAKKTMLLAPNNANGPSSSMEANDRNMSQSYIHSSSRETSDGDSGTVAGSTRRTLPGLIDEIMSKGKRMSYEELCNAVLPHWHNLRKHNGERYAYSSHSQAVLDCLRNRNEWAQLIDRGPKTNSCRKKRKLEADLPLVESENEDAKGRFSKDVEGKSSDSHREDFPKGKRKARKRRRLALQGRGVKEVRKRQKADVVTDDDLGLDSHSSEGTESIFSENESQGAKTGVIESEASSSSSDET